MQTIQRSLQAAQPRVFRYSLDWRFLLPATPAGSVYVIAEDEPELGAALERVGIPVSNYLSFSEIGQSGRQQARALVLPFGLPVRWVGENQADQIEFYRSLGRLLEPGGSLLIGFNNARNSVPSVPGRYHISKPHRVMDRLAQAGFQSIKIYGAMSDLNIPEYVFDLRGRAMNFAMHQRFQRKRAVRMGIQLLGLLIGWRRIAEFLPCYYAVAAV